MPEVMWPCRRGHVAFIHPTRDFYIALSSHDNWGSAHTVWGVIDDLKPVEDIVSLRYAEEQHTQTFTIMRMLLDPVPFALELDGLEQ
jgi:hypothetical protein